MNQYYFTLEYIEPNHYEIITAHGIVCANSYSNATDALADAYEEDDLVTLSLTLISDSPILELNNKSANAIEEQYI